MLNWKFAAHRIKMAREARDLSQKQLAEMLGVPAQQVQRWEAGEVAPGQDSLTNICNVLQTPPRFFFINDDDNNHRDAA